MRAVRESRGLPLALSWGSKGGILYGREYPLLSSPRRARQAHTFRYIKFSARRPRHIPPCEHMEVQVRHALPRLLADVGDHAVALDAHFFCHLGDDLKDMRDHGAVLGVDA